MAISTVSRYIDGIEYQIVTDYDESPDFSFMGDYTDNPDYNHIVIARLSNGDRNRGECYYWQSAQTQADLESERQWYRKLGYSKHDVYTIPRQHVYQNYKRMEAYNRGEWCSLFITVTAYIDGVEVAYDSLGSIASDGGADYIEQIEDELIAECQAQLPETKARLEAVIEQIA